MRRLSACLAVLLLAMLAACGGGGPPQRGSGPKGVSSPSPHLGVRGPTARAPGARPTGADGVDWLTYHRDPARSGVASGVHPPGRLSPGWRARLDGAVYAQPLVVGKRVIAATENDTLYALDRGTGHVRWKSHVGTPVPLDDLPCGNIDPLGITGTPVYDPATHRVFAVAETTGYHHVLVGVDVATGKVEVRRDIPTPDGHPRYDQQRAALLLTHDRVYAAFGGLLGDCGPYVGSVVGVPTSGHGKIVSYRVPTKREGGIWATGGPTLGPGGTIYVSVGNGAATSRSDGYDGSDSVVALTPALRRASVFAPRTWPEDNAGDLDLGSMSPAVLPNGRVLIAGKRGTAYLLRASDLGGVGGEITEADVCEAYGGPAHDGTTAYVPCIDGGLAAVRVEGDEIHVLWRGPDGTNGSPVIGGGAVWVVDWDAGTLYALDPGTGHVRGKVRVASELPHFTSPTLAAGRAFVGTPDGVVSVTGA